MNEHYEDITQDELAKLEQYRILYEATHPYPEEQKPQFWKELGLEAGALIASALGSIVLSAIRTSTIFMLTEALLIAAFDQENLIPETITSGFPLVSMIVSLVAFEGYLSAHGFMNGKKSKRLKISSVAMWLCFGVTISAGLSASFGLLGLNTENVTFQIISWILAVLTAIGAPVVAYYGSMNLGVIMNQWDKLQRDAKVSFLNELDSWNQSFQISFYGKRSQKLFAEHDRAKLEQLEQSDSRSTHQTEQKRVASDYKEQIQSIAEQQWQSAGKYSPIEIARILVNEYGMTQEPHDATGYISTYLKNMNSGNHN